MKVLCARFERPLKYVLVGAWNTLFGYATFAFLYWATDPARVHYALVLVVSQIIALTNAYVGYKLVVFRTRGNLLREYLRFYGVYGLTFLVNLVLMVVFVEWLRLSPVVAQGIIAIVVVILGYVAHRRFSFSAGEHRPSGPA